MSNSIEERLVKTLVELNEIIADLTLENKIDLQLHDEFMKTLVKIANVAGVTGQY